MSDLAAFQDDFVRALRRDAPFSHPALTVHANTVAKAALDALADNYPTVERLVGEEWMRACAWRYLAQCPPANPRLITYGESFPDFLADFAPAGDMPYLASIARLDLLWREAHLAADSAPLPAEALAGLDPELRTAVRLDLAPSTRFAAFAEPALTIWRLNRDSAPPQESATLEIDWVAEHALFTRPFGTVEAAEISAPAFALLCAVARGATLEEAHAATGSAAERSATPDETWALTLELCARGAFAAPSISHPFSEEPPL